jgi:uncharacterized membrane protein
MTGAKEITRAALKAAADTSPTNPDSPLSGKKGVAAGVALAALPFAAEKVAKVAAPKVSELGDQAKEKATEKVKATAAEAGEKLAPDLPAGAKLLGKLFGGESGGGESKLLGKLFGGESGGEESSAAGKGGAAPGFGSGRRMPVQQAVDVAVPRSVAYNQWTQFEDWPEFMHRLESVEQVDDATVAFSAKIWGISRRFEATILEQRPDERIEWDVSQGIAHTGVVTFHEFGDKLTRIEVTLDVEPSGLIEKAARGMRFVKRAVRGDLHRFKAYVELNEDAEGGWRGTIEDGEVKRRTERRSTGSSQSRSHGSRSRGGRGSGSSAKGRTRGSSNGSGSGSRKAGSGQ